MLQPRVEMLPPAQQRFRPELRGAAFRTTGGHRPGPIMLNVDAAAELRRVAKRMVWFKPPEEALADSALFLSYAMTYGTVDDLRVVRAHYTDDQLRQALRSGLPGIFDARSWAYWHAVLDVEPVPDLPVRRL